MIIQHIWQSFLRCTPLAAPALGMILITTAPAALIDFNTAGDLANHFNHTATLPFAEADAVGVGNPASRGLQVSGTTDSGAVLKTSSLSFGSSGAQVSASAFLHTATALGTTGEDRIFELNIVGLNTNIPTGAHTGIGAKLEFVPNADGNDTIGVEFRRNNADVAGSQTPDASAFDIKANTWYKATFTAINGGAGNPIPALMVLDEYSADGTSLVAANVFSQSFNIPSSDINIDAEVWGAFRVRNGTRLLSAIDNFETVQLVIPEPTSLGLIGLSAVVVLGIRRRAQVAS
jgi:hypothetical protein